MRGHVIVSLPFSVAAVEMRRRVVPHLSSFLVDGVSAWGKRVRRLLFTIKGCCKPATPSRQLYSSKSALLDSCEGLEN